MICSITRAQFLPYHRSTRLCLCNKNDYILSRCHCLPLLVNRRKVRIQITIWIKNLLSTKIAQLIIAHCPAPRPKYGVVCLTFLARFNKVTTKSQNRLGVCVLRFCFIRTMFWNGIPYSRHLKSFQQVKSDKYLSPPLQ